MKHIAIAIVAVTLGACAGGKITPAETVLTACQTFNSALAAVTVKNNTDPLSAKMVKRVDSAIAMTDGLCGGDAPGVNDSAIDIAAVQGANLVLQAVLGGN